MAAEDYVGPPGKEKKFHQTHFQVRKTLKLKITRDNGYEWVQFAPGRYKRVKKEVRNAQKES